MSHTDSADTATTIVSIWAATHTGLVRSTNEDCFGATGLTALGAAAERDGSCDGAIAFAGPIEAPVLAVVADGLGGHPCGEVASQLAVDHLLRSGPGDAGTLVAAVHGANEALFAAMGSNPAAAGMGTTIAALLVTSDGVAAINVGDSCIFELIDDRLVQLTVDDAPAGRSTLPGIPSTVVTQTLGGVRTYRPVEPHLFVDDLISPRRFLLCTDGLTNYVARSEIAAAMRDATGEVLVNQLIEIAVTAGAPDNITVIAVNAQPGVSPRLPGT